MADVMIAVMPFVGHVAPIAAVARGFLADGHAVRVYTGSAHAPVFAALGAETIPWTTAPDFDEHDLDPTFPALRGRKGPRQMLANVEHLFIRTAAAQSDDLVDGLGGAPLGRHRRRQPQPRCPAGVRAHGVALGHRGHRAAGDPESRAAAAVAGDPAGARTRRSAAGCRPPPTAAPGHPRHARRLPRAARSLRPAASPSAPSTTPGTPPTWSAPAGCPNSSTRAATCPSRSCSSGRSRHRLRATG